MGGRHSMVAGRAQAAQRSRAAGGRHRAQRAATEAPRANAGARNGSGFGLLAAKGAAVLAIAAGILVGTAGSTSPEVSAPAPPTTICDAAPMNKADKAGCDALLAMPDLRDEVSSLMNDGKGDIFDGLADIATAPRNDILGANAGPVLAEQTAQAVISPEGAISQSEGGGTCGATSLERSWVAVNRGGFTQAVENLSGPGGEHLLPSGTTLTLQEELFTEAPLQDRTTLLERVVAPAMMDYALYSGAEIGYDAANDVNELDNKYSGLTKEETANLASAIFNEPYVVVQAGAWADDRAAEDQGTPMSSVEQAEARAAIKWLHQLDGQGAPVQISMALDPSNLKEPGLHALTIAPSVDGQIGVSNPWGQVTPTLPAESYEQATGMPITNPALGRQSASNQWLDQALAGVVAPQRLLQNVPGLDPITPTVSSDGIS